MFKWFEKLKNYAKNKKGGRGVENLVIFLILGVIIIIVASSFFSEDKNTGNGGASQQTVAPVPDPLPDEIQELEGRLEQILSEIEGAGNVKVMITVVSDGEVVHAYNNIEESNLQEEKSSAGILRTTDEIRREQEMVFMDSDSGKRVPVISKRIGPEIKGVVVVADGAGSGVVRQNITGAVEALLGIPSHRIQVFKRK